MPIEGLRLTDIIGSGKVGLTARYTKALELNQVRIKTEQGDPVAIRNCQDCPAITSGR